MNCSDLIRGGRAGNRVRNGPVQRGDADQQTDGVSVAAGGGQHPPVSGRVRECPGARSQRLSPPHPRRFRTRRSEESSLHSVPVGR